MRPTKPTATTTHKKNTFPTFVCSFVVSQLNRNDEIFVEKKCWTKKWHKKIGGLIRESNPGHSHIRFSNTTRSEYRTTGPISLV